MDFQSLRPFRLALKLFFLDRFLLDLSSIRSLCCLCSTFSWLFVLRFLTSMEFLYRRLDRTLLIRHIKFIAEVLARHIFGFRPPSPAAPTPAPASQSPPPREEEASEEAESPEISSPESEEKEGHPPDAPSEPKAPPSPPPEPASARLRHDLEVFAGGLEPLPAYVDAWIRFLSSQPRMTAYYSKNAPVAVELEKVPSIASFLFLPPIV